MNIDELEKALYVEPPSAKEKAKPYLDNIVHILKTQNKNLFWLKEELRNLVGKKIIIDFLCSCFFDKKYFKVAFERDDEWTKISFD